MFLNKITGNAVEQKVPPNGNKTDKAAISAIKPIKIPK